MFLSLVLHQFSKVLFECYCSLFTRPCTCGGRFPLTAAYCFSSQVTRVPPPSSLFFYFCNKDKRHGQTRQLSRIDYDRAPCLSYCSHLVCPVKCANLFHMCFGSPARNLIVSREFRQIPNLQADLQAEGRLEFLSWSLSVYRVILDTYVSPSSILGS